MQIEISVPRCSSTSKNMCPFSVVVMPKRLFRMARWPELDIGRNSAIPCTSPSIIALITVIGTFPHDNFYTSDYITIFFG